MILSFLLIGKKGQNGEYIMIVIQLICFFFPFFVLMFVLYGDYVS